MQLVPIMTFDDSRITEHDLSSETVRAEVERLFNAHYQGLCAFVLRFVHSRDVAEDVVQELFLRIWEKLDAGAISAQITEPYLYGAARNLSINVLKRGSMERRHLAEECAEARSIFPAPDAGVVHDELASAVKQAIAQLPQRCRLVFMMSRDRHMTYSQIAQVLDISVKAVEAHMARALKGLRDAVK